MKILYIHGLNSNKDSSTGKMVKKYFTKKLNAEVITETFNLLDIEEVRKKIYKIVTEQDINVVIASSLGAFVALTLGDAVAKILFNPCMLPSTILQSLDPTIPDSIIEKFKRREIITYDNVDCETREYTYAAFGMSDELFSFKELFKQHFRNRYIEIQGGKHKLNEEQLHDVLDQLVPKVSFIRLYTPAPQFEDEDFIKRNQQPNSNQKNSNESM